MRYIAALSLFACAASALPSTRSTVGEAVLEKALEAEGLPYAWGGGSCDGPSGDKDPYDYGEVGFDCSGLVSWAVCQVTGRDLFSEGLRVTRSMYCADEETLGYTKYSYDERQAGDAVFFGGECDCDNWETIYHVGLMMDSDDRMWNAPSDDANQVQENAISTFGDTPCPYVIRFE
ncbi:hypothetical protein BJX61DRAFT_540872 [Aspergillus egyptiacus]|nr:hypothetical protein BJX61DRAFT_540872 [Aspergillus egyptiacus]